MFRQNCSFQFFLYQQLPFAYVDKLSIGTEEGWFPDNSNWIYISHSIHRWPRLDDDDFYVFSFQFKRKHQYFVINLFLPGYVLLVLELTTFCVPPESTDRPAFAATIMLAMFVLHSQTLSYLPKTPQPIVAAYAVVGCILYGTAMTIYSGLICHFSTSRRLSKNVRPPFGSANANPHKIYHFIDLIAFFLFSFALLCFFIVPLTLMLA